MKKRYGAIVWHNHGDDFRSLNLEVRKAYRPYEGYAYLTFLTGANYSPLTDADIEKMRQYAKDNDIILTTDKVTTRKYK